MNLDRTHPDFAWKVFDRAQAFIRQNEKRGHEDLPRIKELIARMREHSGDGFEAKQLQYAVEILDILEPEQPKASVMNDAPESPNDALPIQISTTPSVRQATMTRKGTTWGALRTHLATAKVFPSKDKMPLLIAATFANDRRADKNLEQFYALIAECDGGIPMEEAVRLAEQAGMEAFFYSTPSDGEPQKGHCWRLIAPTSKPFSPDKHKDLLAKANGALDGALTIDSATASRIYYWGQVEGKNNFRSQYVPGACFDTLSLPSIPVANNPAPSKPKPAAVEVPPEAARAEALAYLQSLENVGEGQRNNALFKAAAHLHGLGLDEDTALTLCRAHFPMTPPLDDVEIETTVASAYRGAQNPAGSESVMSHFDDLGPQPDNIIPFPKDRPRDANRFVPVPDVEFCSHPAPAWLVRNVIPRAELVVLFGESTGGKSFVAEDIAYAVVRGVPWFGEPCEQGRVVYVCAEGVGGFRKRVKAYRHQHGLTATGIEVISVAPDLLNHDDVSNLIRGIGQARLVIIDTLAASTPGGNENTSEAMGKALHHCKAIHKASGATILLVAHTGKDQTKGVRGWSGIKAAADAQLEVIRVGGEEENGALRYVKIDKQKDGVDGLKYYFKLLPVTLGLDEQGDPIESCVVEQVNEKPAAEGNRATGKWQVAVFKAVLELQSVDGQGALRDDVLNSALDIAGFTDGDAKARKKAFYSAERGLRELIVKSLARVEDGRVLIVNASSEGK